jgi:hypothetical protein
MFRWPRYFPALGLAALRCRGSARAVAAPGPAPACREEQERGGLLAVGRTTRLQAVRRLPLRDEPAAARGTTPTRIWAGGSRR